MKIIIESDDWGLIFNGVVNKRMETDQEVADLIEVLHKAGAVFTPFVSMKDFNMTDTWRQGIEAGVMVPQYHGYDHPVNQIHDDTSLIYGADRFRRVFGHYPESFTAPCYRWSRFQEQILSDHGVKTISTVRMINRRWFYTGKGNRYGQRYIVRNCFFEYSTPLDKCIREVDRAFKRGRPAVISTHRINYINGKNLIDLGNLLRWIKKEWPETVFTSSNRLLHDDNYSEIFKADMARQLPA